LYDAGSGKKGAAKKHKAPKSTDEKPEKKSKR